MLLYIERKWLFMRNLATILPLKSTLSRKFHRFNAIDGSIEILNWISKNFIKIKNCKTFYEAQAASHLKEIIHPPPNPPAPGKILLLLWNKNFLTEIYSNIQTFAFKVLQECSSWESRNGAVQFFFSHQTETCFLQNI